MRTKCAISDAFVRDCVFTYCASVTQYVYSLSAEHCFRLRNNAISAERVRDCALSTHSVFRPLASVPVTAFLPTPPHYRLGVYYESSGEPCVKVKLHYAYKLRNLVLCIRDCAVAESKKCSADREYMP